MSVTVDKIIELIHSLPEPERDRLRQRLAEEEEAEWRRQAQIARETAGLDPDDHDAIQALVNRERYGQ